MTKKSMEEFPKLTNPKRPKPGPDFEGPLKPGKIKVPRSPITNPRDLLPPIIPDNIPNTDTENR